MAADKDRSRTIVLKAGSVLPLLLALAIFIVYSGALRNGFTNWDDDKNFLTNLNFRGLGWGALRWMFVSSISSSPMGNYEPLSWFFFAVTYALWGLAPAGYHLLGVLLHIVVALLLYFTTIRLLRLAIPSWGDDSETASHLSAGIAALFFAAHPLRVENVVWVSAQHYVLACLFILVSTWSYLRSIESWSDRPAHRVWLGAALVSYALSLLAFSVGVTFPFVLLILDDFLRRHDAIPGKPDWRRLALGKTPFFMLAVLGAVAELVATRARGWLNPIGQFGLAARFSQALFGLAFYLWKTLDPSWLSPFYPLPAEIDPLSGPFLWSGLFVLTVTLIALRLRRSWPSGIAAWAFYIATLLPVLVLARNGRQIAADRYTYLPSLGLAVLMAGALTFVWKRKGPRVWLGASLMIGLMIGGLCYLTRRQISIWRDSESLLRCILSVDSKQIFTMGPVDKSMAHDKLAVVLAGQGRLEEAVAEFREAVRIDPGLSPVRNNLGQALAEQGRPEEAIAEFREAVRLDPQSAQAHFNWGLALARQGRLSEAIAHFRQTLRITPGLAAAHYNLALALAGQGRPGEAMKEYREAYGSGQAQ